MVWDKRGRVPEMFDLLSQGIITTKLYECWRLAKELKLSVPVMEQHRDSLVENYFRRWKPTYAN